MKLLLVGGCLEPGVDGVGDYTRRLATELTALGHACFLLGLSDRHVSDVTRSEIATPAGPIPCVRIPFAASWQERVAQGKAFRESIAPDWVSFQIVLYGFDRYGISPGLGGYLRTLAGDCPSEVMFHEIWIGAADQASLKMKLIGRLQRHVIADLLAKVRPKVVHTHTPLYQYLLGRVGACAKILPLFGNIPLAPAPDPDWLAEKWPSGWGRIQASGREAWWIFVLFGSIHPEWDGHDFWKRATAAAQRAGKICVFVSVGRPGGGERALQQMRTHDSASWMSLQLGAQSEADVSQCLFAADFGVSPAPPEYLPKSGTAVAMLEHGLPVIATRPSYRYKNCPPDVLSPGLPNVVCDFKLLGTVQKTRPGSRLPEIARQFIADLQAALTS